LNHWPFIIAAYGVTALGTLGVVAYSYWAMRRAEGKAGKL
jgi:hypothetical protein